MMGGGGMGRGYLPAMDMGGPGPRGPRPGLMGIRPGFGGPDNPNLMTLGERMPLSRGGGGVSLLRGHRPPMRGGGYGPPMPRGGMPPRPSPPMDSVGGVGFGRGSFPPRGPSPVGIEPRVAASPQKPPKPSPQIPEIPEENLPPHNQCEILIFGQSDSLNAYAEVIEKGIRDIGLTVDMMYPHNEVSIAEFVQGLAGRGTKFAVLIRQDNEARHSVSLHVLKRGGDKCEEHRNMPLKIAYNLMREAKAKIMRDKISYLPIDVRTTIEGILEDKLITDQDYQACIKYLHDRWQKQHEFDGKTEYDRETGILSEGQITAKISKILGYDERASERVNNAKLEEAVNVLMNSSSILKALQNENAIAKSENDEPLAKHSKNHSF